MILVTGVTGTTGGATLRALLSRSTPLRVLVRDPGRFRAPDGVEVATGSYEDAPSLDAALDGVDALYLVSPVAEDQAEREGSVVGSARRAGVRHIVRLSALGAENPEQPSRLGASHHAVERAIRESGMEWTFLRPNGFMQNYLLQARSIAGDGSFRSALSTAARYSMVDADDIGEAAAVVLTEPGHEGRGYTLTGPESLNDDDVAAILTHELGRHVRHVQVPLAAMQDALRGRGAPEFVVQALTELWAFYETGGADAVSPDLERLLGRPAGTLNGFVRRHLPSLSPAARG